LELKLRAARDAAIAANKAKSTFLANMSHEIRTPLNGILGMLQLLQPMITDNKQREYVDLAIISSQRLTSLLSDILDFSRIESGQLAIEVHPFAVTDLQDALLGLFHITAQKKNLTLTVDIDPQLPAIVGGDKFRVQQILFNLVGNALKFTSFGSVQVSINALPLGKTLDHFQIYFEVKDTGSGISEKHLEKIFEPFMQAEGSYERKHQGVGLGLSIVHRLISLMRGTLCIDTAPKEGTTIGMSLSMTYPVLDTRPTPVPHRSKKHTQIPHLEILLVEDDEVNLFAARHLLQRLGHQVIVARNGQEAVTLAMSQDFDVIFMDIQMPVMDGLEATKAIRAFPGPRAQVPIIAMTAYAMNGDQELFLTSGMDSYIPKPVDKHTLEQTLEHTFSGSKHKN
jgi:CheY-like chemotaxis protein